MTNDPTPEDLEAQMRETEADMAELAGMLENEANLLGLLAKEQGRELAAQAQEHLPLIAGGAAGVGLLLALLLGRSDSGDDLDDVPVRELDDDYVSLLARVIRHRLRQDDEMPLGEALAQTLREQAPVLYRRPPQLDDSGSSWGRRLLGLGLLAAFGVGANYVAKELTGRSLVDLATGGSSPTPRPAGRDYDRPHGTAGGEMPDPDKPPAAADVFGRHPAEAAPFAEGAPPPAASGDPEPTDRPDTTAPSTPSGRATAYDKVHGTSGAEMPDPDATEAKRAPKGGQPAAEGADGPTDPAEGMATPKGDLPGEPPASKKKGKGGA